MSFSSYLFMNLHTFAVHLSYLALPISVIVSVLVYHHFTNIFHKGEIKFLSFQIPMRNMSVLIAFKYSHKSIKSVIFHLSLQFYNSTYKKTYFRLFVVTITVAGVSNIFSLWYGIKRRRRTYYYLVEKNLKKWMK